MNAAQSFTVVVVIIAPISTLIIGMCVWDQRARALRAEVLSAIEALRTEIFDIRSAVRELRRRDA